MTTNVESKILYGGPDTPNFDPDAQSLGEVALKKLAENGNNVIVINAQTGDTLTSNQLRAQSIRVAECLQHDGVQEGDVISICSENRFEFLAATYGAVFLGATVAPLNTSYIAGELHHAVNLSKPKIIFTSAGQASRVVECAKNNSFIKKIIYLDDAPAPNIRNDVITLSDFLNNKKVVASQSFTCKPVDMNKNIMLVLCSSGTTGLAKGVQLTQSNLMTAVSSIYRGIELMKQLADNVTTLSIMPWFHAYGIMTTFGLTLGGQQLVALPKYSDSLLLRSIERYKVDVCFFVPPILVMLAKHPAVDNYDLSSLKVLYSGAAPLSEELCDAVKARVPVMAILQGFGMSEMTLSVLMQSFEFQTPGSVGTLRPGSWGKIVDPETGALLGANERGEMCFKGSAIMKGYVGNEEATRNTIDEDGWLHTGDVGYYTETGEWFIVDRLKELIKFKGYQVPPAEIEALLLTHSDIDDAAVIGVPDEVAGELTLGFVVRKPNAKLSEQDVIDFVAGKVSYPKQLHGGVRFIATIPKNATGKILRKELRDLMKTIKSKL